MKRDGVWICLSVTALLLLGALGIVILRDAYSQDAMAAVSGGVTVVIDPGHGGEDGGAVAADGTVESGVNLAVARRLDAVLRLCGCRTLLLRTEDVSLHDPSAATTREKKVSDLHNRVAMVERVPSAHVISIHQNHFPQPQYHGAQVFYAGGPMGQPWAELTQGNLRGCIEPENKREAKPIAHTVYFMNHISCPAILVECGFLSNPEEAEKLVDPAYQTKLAVVIGGSYLQSVERELIPTG